MQKEVGMTTLICYRRCSTCQGVRKQLEKLGIEYESREIDEANPTEAELRTWHKQSGLPLSRFFNTSGMKYRELGLAKKRKEMSEDEQYKLLATDGMLVKRPILFHNGHLFVGPDVKKYLMTLE